MSNNTNNSSKDSFQFVKKTYSVDFIYMKSLKENLEEYREYFLHATDQAKANEQKTIEFLKEKDFKSRFKDSKLSLEILESVKEAAAQRLAALKKAQDFATKDLKSAENDLDDFLKLSKLPNALLSLK
jgi:gamma-glutamyl phosphate reductase